MHQHGKRIQAAKVLEAEGIPCNLTLLFGLHQAQACADAKVTLISLAIVVFWIGIKAEGVDQYPIEKDPGVLSVKKSIITTSNTAFQHRSWGQASAAQRKF